MVLGWKLHPRVEGWGAGLLSAGSLGSQRAATVPCPTAGLSRVLSGKAMESWAAPQGETRDVCTWEGPGHGGGSHLGTMCSFLVRSRLSWDCTGTCFPALCRGVSGEVLWRGAFHGSGNGGFCKQKGKF